MSMSRSWTSATATDDPGGGTNDHQVFSERPGGPPETDRVFPSGLTSSTSEVRRWTENDEPGWWSMSTLGLPQ